MKFDVYHSLFLGCTAGAVLLICISAVLYVLLDIRTAWRVLTGIKKKNRTCVHTSEMEDRQKMFFLGKKKRQSAEKVQKTVVLTQKKDIFCVEREIMLVYTDVEL